MTARPPDEEDGGRGDGGTTGSATSRSHGRSRQGRCRSGPHFHDAVQVTGGHVGAVGVRWSRRDGGGGAEQAIVSSAFLPHAAAPMAVEDDSVDVYLSAGIFAGVAPVVMPVPPDVERLSPPGDGGGAAHGQRRGRWATLLTIPALMAAGAVAGRDPQQRRSRRRLPVMVASLSFVLGPVHCSRVRGFE